MKFSARSAAVLPALAISLFSWSASAQVKGADLPDLDSAKQSADKQATQTPTQTPTQSGKATKTGSDTAKASDSDSEPTRGVSTTAVITGGGEAGTASGPIPSITGNAAATTGGALPIGLPTLSGQYKVVPASVPPTANAPFMQTSSLPEGTVFIAVGAILGFLAMSVLLWRGLVAWSLHRSVKRAAQHQTMSDTKALFGQNAPPPPFYKYSDRDSTISLSGMANKGGKKAPRPTTASNAAASASSLFFSPTAGAAMQQPGNRGSNYLPAGYYAAGASAPANNQSHITLGHDHGPSISLSNLGPQAQGYSRARSLGQSPPDSPAFSGQTGQGMRSSSTLNLNRGYGGDERAPSAYLEDLFDGDGTQPRPVSGHHQPHGHRTTPSGRF